MSAWFFLTTPQFILLSLRRYLTVRLFYGAKTLVLEKPGNLSAAFASSVFHRGHQAARAFVILTFRYRQFF
jgi:hypothetical protein